MHDNPDYVQLWAWFVICDDGTLRLATEDEAVEARLQEREAQDAS